MADAGLHQRRRRRPRRARTAADGGARARRGSALLRRLHRPGTAGQVPDGHRRDRRLHDARSAHAADRAGRACATGWRTSTSCSRKRKRAARAGRADCRRSAHRRGPRARRRPHATTSRSTTARSPRGASPAPSSSRSSICRRSSTRPPTDARDMTPATRRDRRADVVGVQPADVDARATTTASTKGAITLRRALALSRNIATIKVAEATGYEQVAALWRRVGAGTPPRPYPSIALGVFEATPFEIATAYTAVPERRHDQTAARDLEARQQRGHRTSPCSVDQPRNHRAARHDVPRHEHDAQRHQRRHRRRARAPPDSRSTRPASRARPTICATRGSSASRPELLTVVWVGLDDNQPLGLSGTQAALPIWTTFMMRALAGRPNVGRSRRPEGIVFVDIDRDTGKVAVAGLPARLPRVVPRRAPSRPRLHRCTRF